MAQYSKLTGAIVLFALSPVVLLLAGCGGGVGIISPGTTGGGSPSSPASAAILTFTPASAAFNSVPLGTTQSSTATLTNSGSAAATVSQVNVTGAGFGITAASLPWTIGAKQTHSFSVTFDPPAPGNATGSIAVTANVTVPALPLTGSGVGPALSVSPTSLNFGTVAVGQSQTLPLTISNRGNAAATISQLNLSGDPAFSYSGVNLPLSIQPNASASVSVNYAPTSAIDPSATLQVVGNAQPLSVTLTGSAGSGTTGPGQTWYVRTDGGTRQQCTGLADAAYPGSGTNQPCAFKHPFWLVTANLSSSDWKWIINGGDTVVIEPGTYYMGQGAGAPRPGQSWVHCVGDIFDCYMPPPPSGTATQHTRILGRQDYLSPGSCHNAAHTGLVNAPMLAGVDDTYYVLDLEGTNYVDIECLDLTDATQTESPGGGAVDDARYGIAIQKANTGDQGPANLTLSDISVDGLEVGMVGQKVNLVTSDVTTMSDIYLRGNDLSGWQGDSGLCNGTPSDCEGTGTLNISYMTVEWNGCDESYPTGSAPGTPPANGYLNCRDDNGGGYGDGVAFNATGSSINIDHSVFRWNTQDGLDSLHTSDDPAVHPAEFSLTNSWSEGNQGQAFKLGFDGVATVRNNVAIDNCFRLSEPFPGNPAGYNFKLSDFCRAAGDQWGIAFGDGGNVTMQFNTTVGYGATAYDIGCAHTCTTNYWFKFEDNITVGETWPGYNAGQLPGGFYEESGIPTIFTNSGSSVDHNLWFQMKNGCPQAAGETAAVCADPLLTSESSIDNLIVVPTKASPAAGAGVAIGGVTTDFTGATRPALPSIGAFEPTSTLPAIFHLPRPPGPR